MSGNCFVQYTFYTQYNLNPGMSFLKQSLSYEIFGLYLGF